MALNRLSKGQLFSAGELKPETSAGDICPGWLKCLTAPPVPTDNWEALQCWSWDYKWPITSTGATNLQIKVGKWVNSQIQSVQTMKEGTVLSFHPRGHTVDASTGQANPITFRSLAFASWVAAPSRLELSSLKGYRSTVLLHSDRKHPTCSPEEMGAKETVQPLHFTPRTV